MANGSNKSSLPFILFVFFNFYSLGSGQLESILNYPSWYIIGPTEEWLPYRQHLFPRIISLLAVPALGLQTIALIVLIAKRPPAIPRWTLWTVLVLVVIPIISSATIQIPMQMELDKAYSKETIDRLIITDIWLRLVPAGIGSMLTMYMIHCMSRFALRFKQIENY